MAKKKRKQKSGEVKIISELKGMKTGIYDEDHPQRKSIVAFRVVDVTEFLLKNPKHDEKLFFIYADSIRGPIVRITSCGKNIYEGTHIHYHFTEFGVTGLVNNEGFEKFFRTHTQCSDLKKAVRCIFENSPGLKFTENKTR